MEKSRKSGILLAALALTFAPMLAQAFNSATHIYIADKVFPFCVDKTNLYYGSIAPDLAMYAADSWVTAEVDTHADIDLRSFAWTLTQRAFSKGWRTHWGADLYAHGCDGCPPGYVIKKAYDLLEITGPLSDDDETSLEFAHDVIEVTIDLLLKRNDDPLLGHKLLGANLFRSRDDLNLLLRVFVPQKTTAATLSSAESTFRDLINQYGLALSLPKPLDEIAIAELGVQLAGETEVTREMLLEILHYALWLCKDYKLAVNGAIQGIKKVMPSPLCLQ